MLLAVRPRDPGTGEMITGNSAPGGSPESVPPLVMGPIPANIGDKLDRVIDTTTDTRLAVAALSGEVRGVAQRMDDLDRFRADVEQRVRSLERVSASRDNAQIHDQDVEVRIRALERFRYAVPSAAVVLAFLSLLVAVWGLFGK